MFLRAAVIDMVAADGETVAVAAEQKDVQVRPGQTDAGGQRNGAAVNEVRAVAVDEIGKARRTTDPGEGDDFFVIEISFLENFVEGSEHGEIAATRTPGGVIGGDRLFWLSFSRGGSITAGETPAATSFDPFVSSLIIVQTKVRFDEGCQSQHARRVKSPEFPISARPFVAVLATIATPLLGERLL